MKKISILILTFFIFAPCYSQTAEEYVTLGREKGDSGDFNGAIADFTKAIDLDNHSAGYVLRGMAKNILKDFEGAISDFSKYIELYPTDGFVFSNRGMSKKYLGNTEGALADFNKAIELTPEDPINYIERAELFEILQQNEEAIAEYTKAINLMPENHPNLGRIYYQRGARQVFYGTMENACLDLSKAIELGYEGLDYCSIKNVEEYKADGDLKITNGDFKGGIADYTKAIELEPNDQLVYVARGSAMYNTGDYIGAIADFTKGIEFNEKPNTALCYHRRALSKFHLADYSGAMEDLDRAIAEDELGTEYYETRGVLKIQLGQNESGCLDLAKALELGSATAEQKIKDFCG